MKLLFLTNIPSPYRADFFNELGSKIEVEVVFEAERNHKLNDKWYGSKAKNYREIFLKSGQIEEKKINLKILKFLNEKKQDYIVVTNYAYLTEMFALIVLKLRRIPYLMEIDGGLIGKETFIMKCFKSYLIKNATAYLSPSNETDQFLMYYGAKKDVIYRYPFTSVNKADIITETLLPSEKRNIKSNLKIKEDKMILFVGQFIHRKGIDLLIEACSNLPKDVAVCIIGGEPSNEYLNQIEKSNFKNFYFPGFKTKSELKDFYLAADLFVFPTREDIWGLVINEAMAHGLPIITTDRCGSGIELIEDDINGYLVPANNINILTEKIEYIIHNKEKLSEMSKISLDKIKSYSIEKMVSAHLDIIEKIKNSN